ncbi:MAG: hypothetical protein WCO25_03705 [Candidatus Uhrbacteria bacterium]
MSDTELSEPLRALAKKISNRIVGAPGQLDSATLRPDSLLSEYGLEDRDLIASLDDYTRAMLGRLAAEKAIRSFTFSSAPRRRVIADLVEFWHVSPYTAERSSFVDRLLAAGVIAFGDDPPCCIDVRSAGPGPVTRDLLEEIVGALVASVDRCKLEYDSVLPVGPDADAFVYADNAGKQSLDLADPANPSDQVCRRVLLIAGIQPPDDTVKAAMDAVASTGSVVVGLASVVDPVLSHGGHPYARFNIPFCGAFAFCQLMEHFLATGVLTRDRYEACLTYHKSALRPSIK